jgi:hypothetical protein
MTDTPSRATNPQANALADRLEQGAQALITFAGSLTDAEWRMPVSLRDSRAIGIIVHHVASVYPIEIQLAQNVANGQAITGVTSRDIDTMNANHAAEHAAVGKTETLELLRRNSNEAAAAIRALSDEQLRQAAPVSLYEDAPLTSQFVLEDHAVRHSYHHLFLIRRALGR